MRLPEWLTPLILAPEVQRLRDVRLINTVTPTLGALSDVRRLTHALGVTWLGVQLLEGSGQLASSAGRDFLAACVLHDVGSPAFAHLYEYVLKGQQGWTHEGAVRDIIFGQSRPEKRYHQVYFGKNLRVLDTLEQMSASVDNVLNIILGRGELGDLLAGTLDIDNVDNVGRMAWALGLGPDTRSLVELARNLRSSSIPGEIAIPRRLLGVVAHWSDLRRQAYDALSFDVTALAGQAMLTEAFYELLEQGDIGPEQWYLTDEQMLRHMLSIGSAHVQESVRRFSVGDYYRTVYLGWYGDCQPLVDVRTLKGLRDLQARLTEAVGVRCTPYVMVDNGTFSKRIQFRLRDDGEEGDQEFAFGERSRSYVVGVFTPARSGARGGAGWSAMRALAEAGFDSAVLRTWPSADTATDGAREPGLLL